MFIDWSNSGVPEAGQAELEAKILAGIAKVRPQYAELFDRINGVISIEEIVGGNENTLGQSRPDQFSIALKTQLIREYDEWNLVRTISEEIIHYLDHYLGFSNSRQVDAQKAANRDVNSPLSLGMLLLVRVGGKDELMEDLLHPEYEPTFSDMFKTFAKAFPFLGTYRRASGVDKYEWLTEVDHANSTLEAVTTNDQISALATNAQKLMMQALLLRYLSLNGVDIFDEIEAIVSIEESGDSVAAEEAGQRFMRKIESKKSGFGPWLKTTTLNYIKEKHLDADGLEIPLEYYERIKAGEIPPDDGIYLSIINAAMAKLLFMDANWEGPDKLFDIRKIMLTAFPETQPVLESFRERVDLELDKIKAGDLLHEAAKDLAGFIEKDLRKGKLSDAQLLEMAASTKRGSAGNANVKRLGEVIEATILVFQVIDGIEEGGREKVVQLIRDGAVPDAYINGKTLMEHATSRERYEVAGALRDAIKKAKEQLSEQAVPQSPPPPPK